MTFLTAVIILLTLIVKETHGCGRSVPDPSRSISFGNVTVEACRSGGAVRVLRGKRPRHSLVVVDDSEEEAVPAWTTHGGSDESLVALETDQVLVVIDRNEQVSFYINGKKVLEELGHSTTKDESVAQSWLVSKDEEEEPPVLYGGGQYVNGLLDYTAAPLRLRQFNTEAAVPFFTSTGGYGILWDLYGDTVWNPTNGEIQLSKLNNGTAIGEFVAMHNSDDAYYFEMQLCNPDGFGCGGPTIKMTLTMDGQEEKVVFECGHDLANAPSYLTCRADHLRSGETYKMTVEWDGTDQTPRVFYHLKPPKGTMTLQTKDTDFIDYYLIVGNNNDDITCKNFTMMDSVIASYRRLTGPAKMLSRKAYGFWQCRERYMNQTHLLDAAHKFRQLQIPVDNIVQDWQYWGDLGWGPQWDPKLYPDPAAMVKELDTDLHLDFMVSTWSRFDQETKFWKEMNASGLLIPGTDYFDAWNPKGRETYFSYANDAHFRIGVAYLWLDATEPEGDPQLGRKVFGGTTGDALRNTYSLEVSRAIYEGFTHNYEKVRRPFALTRSSFAGQQRYGATLWSGDTSASWDSLRRQIAMSINYGLSGIPLWTCDTGGFFRPSNQYDSPDYHLLLVRWFQFSTFTPLLRVHGMVSSTELWNYGAKTQDIIVKSAINLRYRLLPYLYSGFWRVEREGYTMQRGLVMDFIHDHESRRIADQYMFGESFMVAPIYGPDSSRSVYLPPLQEGGVWRNFYTGDVVEPGLHKLPRVPIDQMPLFVRSSILVLGPLVQHAMDPTFMSLLEVRVYAGCDSTFVLYEDDGRDPSKNRPFTTIRFTWNDTDKHLTIGRREGRAFSGLVATKTISAVLVRPGVGIGVAISSKAEALSLHYNGTQLTLDLSQEHPEAVQ